TSAARARTSPPSSCATVRGGPGQSASCSSTTTTWSPAAPTRCFPCWSSCPKRATYASRWSFTPQYHSALSPAAPPPLLPFLDFLPHPRAVALHLVLTRRAGGVGRA